MTATFEQFLTQFPQLFEDIRFIKQNLPLMNNASRPPEDQWFDLDELRDYLPDKPARATIYGYVSANTIPYHKGAKKLRFLKSEIDAWLKEGKSQTEQDIKSETDTFLGSRRRKMSYQ